MSDNYKTAPTFLYHDQHKAKLFKTQEAVEEAWENGWYGPPWLKKEEESEPLLSEQEFGSKTEFLMKKGVDSRYDDLHLTDKMSWDEIRGKLAEFEATMASPPDDYPDEGDQ